MKTSYRPFGSMMPLLLLGFLLPFMAACGSASAKADNNSDNNNIDSIMTDQAEK